MVSSDEGLRLSRALSKTYELIGDRKGFYLADRSFLLFPTLLHTHCKPVEFEVHRDNGVK